MSYFGFCTSRLAAAAAGCSVLLAIGAPSAAAEPATDSQGFVESAARCATPDVAVAFGSTRTSQVAICKSPSGQYEYRGVRMRDGASLIVPASPSGEGEYVADNDGISYTVTAKSLIVKSSREVLRDEAMLYFHQPETSTASAGTSTPAAPPTTPTSTRSTPPLPAEVGGSGG